MKNTIEIMTNIFNTYDVDWMGEKINDPSDLTCHHIVKKEKDGDSDISNYALLTSASHRLLHYLEDNYHDKYVYLNKIF